MDAALKLFPRIALSLPLVLLIGAPALAQVNLQVSPNTVTIPPTGGGQCVFVQVTTSSTTAVTFSLSTPASWYSAAASNANTTPSTLQICVAQSLSFAPPASTLTVTDTANINNKQNITVNYVVGGGGGAGQVIPNPTTLSPIVPSGSITSQQVSLTTSSTTPVGITATVTGAPTFVTTQVSPATVVAGIPSTLTVTSSAVGLPNGTYINTINLAPSGGGQSSTVTVTLTVGSGGGGTSSFTINPTSVSFSYPSGTQTGIVLVSSSATVIFTATATSPGSWLLVNGTTQTSQQSGTYLSLSVSTTAAQLLAAGTYTGTVTISNPNNPADNTVFNVFLSVATGSVGNLVLTPAAVTVNAAVGGVGQQTQVSMAASNGAPTTYVVSSVNSTGWLTLASSGTGSLPSSIVLNVNSFGLLAGTYQGSVNVTFSSSSGGVNGTQTIPVTLVVGGGGGGTTGGVAPTSLTFFAQTNAVNQAIGQQYITVGGTGTITVSATSTPSGWLSATGTGQAPGYVVVNVNPGGLTAGNYVGTLTITSGSGVTNVPVTLTVTGSTVLQVTPFATINLNFQAGSTNPSTAQISINASDNSSIPFTVSSSTAWVTLGGITSGTTPQTLQVGVNPVGLPGGLNTASITITSSGAANSPVTVPVVALVSGGTTGGSLTLSPSSLTFTGAVNGSAPTAQSLSVSAASATTFTASASVQSGGTSWLSISPSGANLITNQTITVSVNQAGLAQGQYGGTIALTANGVTQNVPVTLVVGGSGTGGTVTASPTSLNFTYDVGGPSPGVQTLTISSGTGGATTFVVTSTGTWLNPGVQSGTSLPVGTTLTVSVNPTGLAAGTYNGTVVATPPGGTALTVPVTLTVTSNTVTAATATGTTLSYSYRVGDQSPATQTINVTGNGSFTATAQSTGGWLSVAPGSGSVTTGSTTALTATVNPANLAAGTFNGTIVVAGTGGTTGSTTINVTLVVTAPLPTISRVTNAASYLAGTISPGEIVSIFGTAIGPTTATGLTIDPATGRVSTTSGGVQVLVNGFLSPMTFASATQVNAVIPYEVKGSLSAVVQIRYLGQTSNAVTVTVAATAPGVFTANSTGTGPVAFLYSNPTFATPTRGDVIVIYATGEGETNPAGVTGKVTTVNATPPLTPQPLLPVVVFIDEQVATVEFFGEAPGIVSGALQLNVRIPNGAQSGARPIRVTIGGQSSQSDVTIQIR